MLYDLNIVWTPSTSTEELEKTLRFAKMLGYDVVALNHIVSPPVPKTITNPIPLLASPPSTSQPNRSVLPGDVASAPVASSSSSSSSSSWPTVLRRVTITVTDPGTTNYKLPDYARAYDLLAVRPTSDKAFQWACISADEASIISLDLSVPLGYHIAPRTAMAAVQRGARFEIAYGQAVQAARGTEGSRSRAVFLGNALALLRATKGRGVLASSEARAALALRGPADVVNLLAVWGLGPEKGTEALRGVPRSVVVNEGIKRRGFRGVVDIVGTAGPDPDPPERREGGAKDKDQRQKQKQKGTSQQQQKQQQQQQGQQGQKRKSDEPGGSAVSSDASNTATMSKRQAKKMRLAAEQAGKGNA